MDTRELFRFKRPADAGRAVVSAPVQQKSLPSISYPLQMFWGLSGEETTATDQIRGMQAYAVYWLAYACMQYRASKLVEAPLWIATENEDGEDWLEGDHPLAELLEQPNPDMEMAELLELVSLYLDDGGRCLLVKNRDRGNRVASLYPFAGDEFTVTPADGRLFGRFRVSTARGSKEYGPDDVIYLRSADPRNLTDAIGPLDVALSHVNIGHEMRRAISAALRNTIRPGAVVETKTAMGDAEWERLKVEVQSQYAGASNNGKTMIADNAAVKMLSRGLTDLELGPVQGDVEAAVCGAFSIHPALIGAKIALENSSGLSDTIEPATRLFYDRVAFPRWGRIERAFTRGLLREVDQNPLRFIRFDRTRVRALQQDLSERTKEAQTAGAFWTVNEQRQHTGQAPLDDERGEQLGVQLRARAVAPAAPAPESAPADAPKAAHPALIRGKARAGADSRAAAWAAFDRKARADEDPYHDAAEEQFEVERAEIFGVFQRLFTGANEGDTQIANLALAVLLGSYAEGGVYFRAWRTAFLPLIRGTFEDAGRELAVSVGVDFDLTNPHTVAAVEARAAALVRNVTETTRDRIRDAVRAAIDEGVGVTRMADRIRDLAFDPAITAQRATTIAQTESAGARNAGLLEAARQSGVIQSKEWLTKQDARVRDQHRPLDGEVVAINAPYSNGMQHPAQQGFPAGEVINCRCTQLFHDQTVEELAS